MNDTMKRGARRQGLCRGAAVLGVVGAMIASAAPAAADISQVVLRIQATNAEGTGSWTALIDAGSFNPDGTYSWTLGAPVQLRSSTGVVVGTLTAGNTFIVEDPLVSLGFSVQAGAVDTAFQITSALLSFPSINPAEGRASGTITATDINSNGTTLTGLHGGSMLRTQYNGFVPAGTTFADLLVGPMSNAEAFGSVADSSDSPGVGFTPIPGTVTDISMQYFFTLSAGDIASGTGTFIVAPAPGALGLLGLAGLAGAGRRRRR